MTDILEQGDALTQLKELDTDSIDALVTDPPYGYSFMNKDWDKAVIGVETWKECLRVLKPGSFAAIMSSPRQDVLSRMIVNLQDAGFRTDFTSIYWTYSQGFPKAANVSKLVDKRAGVERKLISGSSKPLEYSGKFDQRSSTTRPKYESAISEKAKELDGSYAGFQPKPAVEVILMVMKPLTEKTYVDQALANGKGITWLDNCRIPFQDDKDFDSAQHGFITGLSTDKSLEGWRMPAHKHYKSLPPNSKGRFPANLLVSDSVLKDHSKYFDLDRCFDTTFPFIVTPKAAPSERGINNKHPTQKPVKLMSYLITLLSREGDTVLDPFSGSGTTLIAAKILKRKYVGIELQHEYIEIAKARLKAHG